VNKLTDDDIVAALRRVVPEPPELSSRSQQVRRRARSRRRRQLGAGSLAVVAAVAVVTRVTAAGSTSTAPTAPATVATSRPVVSGTIDGLPAALHRPLELPTVPTGAECPVSPSHDFPAGSGFSEPYSGVGSGPVALTGDGRVTVDFHPPASDSYAGTGWPGQKVIWRVSASYTGPVLLRGARLDATGDLRFDHYLDAVGAGGTGAGDATAYPELGYLAGSSPLAARTYPSAVRVQSPGCYGIQVDGTDFTEVIIFSVSAQAAG
jgi:hypothetical protein